jgi:hypothetical protein
MSGANAERAGDLWELHAWAAQAANAAKRDDPAPIVWDLELEGHS